MIRSMRWMILVVVAACESASPPPTSTLAPPAVAPALPPPAIDAAAPPTWQLVLASDYGPCRTSDPRSCHQTWTATPDGIIAKVAYPNDKTKPVEKSSFTLPPAERDTLRALVTSTEFLDGMEHGFACQGDSNDPDATLRLAFNGGHSQYVEGCTRNFAGSSWDDAVAKRIVALVRR
jgi:hypothetical protein